MKRIVTSTSVALAAVLVLAAIHPAPAAAAAEKLDGKAIFLAQKCNLCHTVSSQGIEATTKSAAMKGPDLNGAPQRDAKLLNDYLRKKGDMNGKKHKKEFTGSDEELGALIAWLQKLEKK